VAGTTIWISRSSTSTSLLTRKSGQLDSLALNLLFELLVQHARNSPNPKQVKVIRPLYRNPHNESQCNWPGDKYPINISSNFHSVGACGRIPEISGVWLTFVALAANQWMGWPWLLSSHVRSGVEKFLELR
jgi:hypothetical protein